MPSPTCGCFSCKAQQLGTEEANVVICALPGATDSSSLGLQKCRAEGTFVCNLELYWSERAAKRGLLKDPDGSAPWHSDG